MVQKFIRGKAGGIVLTGGIIAGLSLAASHFKLGTIIKKAALDTGKSGGDIITQPIAGLVESLTSGLENIKSTIPNFLETTGTIGADFQEFATGNRNAIGTFFDGTPEETSNDRPAARPAARVPALDLSNLFEEAAIRTRIVTGDNARTREGSRNSSGTLRAINTSFKSGAEAESALQKAIAESAKLFPQFFKE